MKDGSIDITALKPGKATVEYNKTGCRSCNHIHSWRHASCEITVVANGEDTGPDIQSTADPTMVPALTTLTLSDAAAIFTLRKRNNK